jgi:hypothetical protein
VPQYDRFRAHLDKPMNPTGAVLDLDALRTTEGKLYAVVMQRYNSVGGHVGTLGSIDMAVGVMGMGGVDKTCTLKAIAVDREVRHKFNGGVYFLSLGKDARPHDVINQLSGVVGERLRGEVGSRSRACATQADAAAKASVWPAYHRCLFVCDDL